ncbi:MAG: hypothetical protein A2351_08240 [Omnitrophica bacterium RIFOXYB12_FULL_50_7]|nr:MAG: hypothetical protein A2351_08240 [Omnitrophica bacterium RIFOXYB12_FULL_50_7]
METIWNQLSRGSFWVLLGEDRFVKVIQFEAESVRFEENGEIKTLSRTDFRAAYSGHAFFSKTQAQILGVETQTQDTTLRFFAVGTEVLKVADSKVLRTSDLLKIKGAGWFSKLFKKIFSFFKAVFQAVANVLKKVIQVVTKALTVVFGKTIGNAIASIVLSPVSFFANTCDYIGQGDFKGLFKYWGQIALQIVIQVVVAIIAPYLLGALMWVLGAMFQVLGAIVSAAGQLLGNAIGGLVGAFGSGVGSVISSGIQAGFNFIGNALTQVGKYLAKEAGKIFAKTNGFDFVKDALKNGFKQLVAKFNPVEMVTNLTKPLTDIFSMGESFFQQAFSSAGSFFNTAASLLKDVVKSVGVSIAQDKISRYGEEHKWNSVWIMVANAALESFVEAAEYVATGDEQDFLKFGREAADARAPPTNRPGIFTQIKNAIGKGAGWVSDVLKDAGGAIKSVFVSDSGSGAPNAQLTFGLDGKATSYQQQDELGKAGIAYGLEAIVDGVSAFTSETGERKYLEYDPKTGAALDIKTIGNLPVITKTYEDYFYEGLGPTLKEIGHDLWDVFSLGTLGKVEKILAENPGISDAEYYKQASWAGLTSITNALTFGYQDAIYNSWMENGPSLESVKIGIANNTWQLLPIDDFRQGFDASLSTADRTRGFLMGATKTVSLIGLLAGIKAQPRAKLPTVRGGKLPTTWNEFQTATKGQFASGKERGLAWAKYKIDNGMDIKAYRAVSLEDAIKVRAEKSFEISEPFTMARGGPARWYSLDKKTAYAEYKAHHFDEPIIFEGRIRLADGGKIEVFSSVRRQGGVNLADRTWALGQGRYVKEVRLRRGRWGER